MIKVVTAASWLSRRRFYSFSHMLYRDCIVWKEPEVWRGRRVMSACCNPMLRHPHAFFMAMKDGRPVARVMVGCVDGRGYFSMFDAENEGEAVRALMAEAASWQRRHGVWKMIGPAAPYPLDLGGGVLTEGFDERGAFCDTHNAPYYEKLLMEAGAVPCEERVAYHVSCHRFDMEKYRRAAEWVRRRFGYEVIENLPDSPRMLNDAVCEIMGSEADREGMARAIGAVQPYLLKKMCPVVCVDGRPIGCLLTIRGRNGRARIVTMWVHEAWRRKGVTALLFDSAARAMTKLGIEEIDASWVRADNEASVRSIESAGGHMMHRYKVYCVYI